ncbi:MULTISPECIES: DUF47 domain-containing protein [Lysinibacillus]|uniref:Pit accessory protein n=4 Tax=Lysinibacillus TaxID=400634 RepID=A0A2S5D184_LYSSH|nr:MULTISPECIES: DUF47 domain-containing protein [Lysinibacillus]AHN21662.1 hypothetical protein T479_09575 [Lysinibacillus varians]AVK97213.1 hypothetical protein LS41612_13540 [Lysinibacillus sphaericus]MCS1384427.1 DUF47 domain-containing protein [Lysinibacillus sphaericus]MED4542505.1 DUF47 domain-containing protein [Lysinibacillus sphaericus]OEC03613.1 hypothetical protein GY31_01355 [Lysinibacillus sphaericus]
MFNSSKQDPFFQALLKISQNVKEGIYFAHNARIHDIDALKEIADTMKQYETSGDKLIHELIVMLNKSFMTPIEREDILALANKLDDVIDGMEGCIAHFNMYNLTEVTEPMRQFLTYIAKSTDEMVQAMELLNSKKLVEMRKHAIQIKDYERECDEIFRSSMKQLFIQEKDPMRIIVFKDIYEQFEDIADCCQTVANTIETIIMRNA